MTASAQKLKVGLICELAGACAFAAGVILSVHHYAIGALFVAGVATFAVGWKFRAS